MSEDILICECSSLEHQVIIRIDKDEQEAYLNVHLFKYGFLRRLSIAIKYLFGYKSRFGHWDEFIFKQEHAAKLREVAEFLDGGQVVAGKQFPYIVEHRNHWFGTLDPRDGSPLGPRYEATIPPPPPKGKLM